MPAELALVLPVYNEAACIVDVVRSWRSALDALGIEHVVLVYDDGSTDGTAAALRAFDEDSCVEATTKPNSGHGPTILQGYRQAVERAPWVFQCDSDDEMPPDGFAALWKRREAHAALFGSRTGRQQNAGRALISKISRMTVRLLFGSGVHDVNTPYRLMRADILRVFLSQIPDDTFAPNVILSGAFVRNGLPVCELPVPHRQRPTGRVSLVKLKLWKAAARAFVQTLRVRPRLGSEQTEPSLERAPKSAR